MKTKNSLTYSIKTELIKNWQLYILLIIPVTYIVIFSYIPMLGLQIAFKSFRITQSIWQAPIHPQGVFYHFQRFLDDPRFWLIFENTIILSLYQLVVGAVMPLFLALVIHNVVSRRFKKTVQFITYAPHFISMVVMIGILMQILDFRFGVLNNARFGLGLSRINYIAQEGMFRHLFVWSGVWQNTGYGAIIYLAALSGIDPQLHEAAIVDGAGKLKRMMYIDIPGILPTFIILSILAVGNMLELGFTKAFLLMNPLNIGRSQIIDTFIFTMGLGGGIPGASGASIPDYSYATAIGMTRSILSLVLIVSVNKLSRKVTETSLW